MHAPGQREKENAAEQRQPADDPSDPQGAFARCDHQDHAEHERDDAVEDVEPLVVDVTPEPKGGHQVKDAGRERPACDDE